MKEIQLTQNKIAVVDNEDFEFLNKYKWNVLNDKNRCYAVRYITIKSQDKEKNTKYIKKIIWMHRVIMRNKLKDNELIDHKNMNGLDNRKCNLRICTHSQNGMNREGQGGSSIYKGVCWNNNYQKWRAQIKLNYKLIHLGDFNNEIEAAKAYNVAAKKYFGEFAWLNFKE